MTSLRPWREIAVPHEDVLKGTFQQAEFAADLSRVHKGTASPEYRDPALFFKRTYITEGMRLLLDSVVKRITGQGGDPVIQLQTAFGGGKTHTMLAVYHLARGAVPVADLQGIPPILDAAGVIDLPKARVVVIDGTKLSPNMPETRGNVRVRTMWGDLAWQLGGEEAYERIREADESGTSPGKETLAALIAQYSPCVILIDELVAYIRQFDEKTRLAGGTYDSNITFMQALTEALKAVPTAVLLASLPESDQEAGSQRGVNALRTLEHYFARVQALWKPVAAEEAFEIVRRRLFADITNTTAVESVCRSFAELYIASGAEFPRETQESRYYQRLFKAYPIHPEIFDRLYEDWSSLENFQRTRGVLKLMAKVIHRLWKDGNNDYLIMPGSLPLYDGNTRNEAIYYLPPGWDPVVERDIDGDRAETTEIESRDTRFGSVQACRRVARTVFLGSAPGTPNRMMQGIEQERVLLGSVQPGQQTSVYRDALHRLSDRLYYLNSTENRYWFDTRPNLRREMEERKKRFDEKEDVLPAIAEGVKKAVTKGIFDGIHTFTQSGDIPDDSALRLIVLPPHAHYGKREVQMATVCATEYLKRRGDQPRHRQNRLIFLAADADNVRLLTDHVRSMLAWESIVWDYKDKRIVLDNLMGDNAANSLEIARRTVARTIRETYRWLLVPVQEFEGGRVSPEVAWEDYSINPGAERPVEEIERVLKENEALITEWAPIHLANQLKRWSWTDETSDMKAGDFWENTCRYLYLPRLLNRDVLKRTIEAGADTKDYFGLAAGKDGEKYIDFTFGKGRRSIVVDDSLLLIEPTAATAYEESIRPPETSDTLSPVDPSSDGSEAPDGSGVVTVGPSSGGMAPKPPGAQPVKTRFYGRVEVDPITAKMTFSQIVDEVVAQFTSRPGTAVAIKIEISAVDTKGFDENLQRAVRENGTLLKFKSAEFEME
ncbi:ATP-binding protein [Methanoculleus horonobensis]|uniref:ATP-binding protein n=1 Tax=Methanoculleus horonobensis TaxID=528314 RepID=UPI001F294D5F|nr:DUF499 domain-containing protein [Methanoculleus horonobensis]